MRQITQIVVIAAALASVAGADELRVTNLKAQHRNGQTFITWTDAAEGAAGAVLRYSLYRSDKPITQAALAGLKPCMTGVFNNSAKLFGSAFWPKDRLDKSKPTSTILEGGKPLPMWSGLAVLTPAAGGEAYYAVVATGPAGKLLTKVVAGESATAEAVVEKVAPIRPIKLHDSKTYGRYARIVQITGAKNLPLHVQLHASQGRGGGAGSHGDYYLYFSRPEWGYRDGLPGVFSVKERKYDTGRRLILESRDAIVHPDGKRAVETFWFGYICVPQWAKHTEGRAYPFTERRMLWVIDWSIRRYGADRNRVHASGGSMGAWGSMTFAFRHPEIFAAVYPNRPRTRQRVPRSVLAKRHRGKDPLTMPDGKSDYYRRMDMVRFAAEHHEDLPFVAWCCGRQDGFASWQEEVDMVKALTKARHGFAFAWNNGNHSSGSKPMRRVTASYPPELFALNRSYPAFSHSSIDDDPGDGDPKAGDMEGGINLGFVWKDVKDTPTEWSATISNTLAKAEMTVDITPRRRQGFKPAAGTTLKWTNTAKADGKQIQTGNATVDRWRLATMEKVKLIPGGNRVAIREP